MNSYAEDSMVKDVEIIEQTTADNRSIFIISFFDKNMLYREYMPYIQNGGLFVRTKKKFHLGEEVYLLLQLFDETEKHTISGRVVWLTPDSAQRGLPGGIGVQFESDEASHVRNKIETYLAGMVKSDKTSVTLSIR